MRARDANISYFVFPTSYLTLAYELFACGIYRTAFIILLGDGVVANVVLQKTKGT
jgi:glycerol uptake facilitator-like aquaporin